MIKRICKTCGKEFFTYPSRLKRKGRGVFCSVSCSLKGQKRHTKPHTEASKKLIGINFKKNYKPENHPRWKGGINLENKRIRRSLEYVIWRNEVYKRDNWTCRICGKHCQKKDIVAHHLELFSEYPELRFSVDNGITLCRNCHCEIHEPHQFHKK